MKTNVFILITAMASTTHAAVQPQVGAIPVQSVAQANISSNALRSLTVAATNGLAGITVAATNDLALIQTAAMNGASNVLRNFTLAATNTAVELARTATNDLNTVLRGVISSATNGAALRDIVNNFTASNYFSGPVNLAGNVGVGTANPVVRLDVRSQMVLGPDPAGRLIPADVGGGNYYGQNSALYINRLDFGNSADTVTLDAYHAHPPGIAFRHASGVVGSPENLTNGNQIGYLDFRAYSGTNFWEAGGIQFHVEDGQILTNGQAPPANMRLHTTPQNGQATERLRISANGRVTIGPLTYHQSTFDPNLSDGALSISGRMGIGTSVPTAKLYVLSTNATAAIIDSSHTATTLADIGNVIIANTANVGNNLAGLAFADNEGGNAGASAAIGVHFTDRVNHYGDIVMGGRSALGFTEKMRITSAGDVGIGTVTPNKRLYVSSTNYTVAAFDSSHTATSAGDMANVIIANLTNVVGNYAGVGFADNTGGGAGLSAAIGAKLTDRTNHYADVVIENRSAAGYSEKLRVKSSGDVGIGNSAPLAKLHVTSAGATAVIVDSAYNGTLVASAANIILANTNATANNYAGILFADNAAGAAGGSASFAVKFTDRASHYGDFVFETRSASGYTEKVRIGSAGSVGVGNSAPLAKLHVTSASPTAMIVDSSHTGTSSGDMANVIIANTNNTANNYAGFLFVDNAGGAAGGSASIGAKLIERTSHYADLVFETRSAGGYTEKVRILSTGNLGIGTNAPGERLHVHGNALIRSNLVVNGSIDVRTNISQMDVVMTNWVIGQRYTNTVAGGYDFRRATVSGTIVCNSAVAGNGQCSLYVEHGTAYTNKLTVAAGGVSTLVNKEPLMLRVSPGDVFRFIDESTGSGTIALEVGTGSWVGE